MSELALTTNERTDFTELDNAVREGMTAFLEVGHSLWQIQDRKLYRADYPTFEAYCIDTHNLKRSTAYEFIGFSKMQSNLSEESDKVPETKEQYRQLAKVPKESQVEVWKKAIEKSEDEGTEPTPKVISEVAEPFKPPKPEPIPKRTASKPNQFKEAEAKKKASPLLDFRNALAVLVDALPEDIRHNALLGALDYIQDQLEGN